MWNTKHCNPISESLFEKPQKIPNLFLTLLFYVTVFLPVLRCVRHNTDLLLNSSISKTVRINIAFATTPFKEYSTRFFMVCRLIDFALVVLKLLIIKFCVVIGISKAEFFNFSGTERVKQNEKKCKNHSKYPNLISQSLAKQSQQIPKTLLVFY